MKKGKISLISLGCPKNLVDSEKLIQSLREKGIGYSSDTEDSDIIMINTCGFIEDAKKESVEEILKLAALKTKGKKRKLIVFGCLAKRYGERLKKEIPEIDAIWGVGEDKDIVEYCSNILDEQKTAHSSRKSLSKGGVNKKLIRKTTSPSIKDNAPAFGTPSYLKRGKGELISPPLRAYGSEPTAHRGGDEGEGDKLSNTPYAYLKIAEGCDRKCSYCIIPEIRGKFRSLKPDEILREAENLVNSGIKELILVAQDITSYGKELDGYNISRLIREIAFIKGDFWIRLLYLYPTSITDELIDTIKNEEKVCRYIDMPLQHSEDRILKLMGRGGSRQLHKKLILKLRKEIPDISIRTTLIVGFPGETETDFEGMEKFVQEMRFDRLGVFRYSNEEGTYAYKLKGQLLKKIKDERYDRIMKAQSEISYEKNKALIGKSFKALVDEVDEGIAIARIYSQAPEIDGVVMIKHTNINKGDFIDVEIVEAYDYDLKGIVVG
ncbi:MAG: ribosomal protein S12 methylthiotransferase RimO [Nitrospirae bacterium GWC2_42_7]|nr:MAG: ribosomal protein S12 methylthiotransferase RimO [Nitrospirae bacterium GWC2_42_7]